VNDDKEEEGEEEQQPQVCTNREAKINLQDLRHYFQSLESTTDNNFSQINNLEKKLLKNQSAFR
jgi:hypothetical protein